MASINEKLNYINETKSLIKNKLNDLGSGIEDETTFREYTEKIEDLYEEWPKISDEDTNINLENTKKGKMKLILKGNTEQFITTGKNKLSNDVVTENQHGVQITKNSDGSVTLNGTSTESFNIVWKDTITLAPGTYYIGLVTTTSKFNLYFNKSGGGFEILGSPANSSYYTLTLTETITFPGLKSYIGVAGRVFNNETFYPMITTTLPFNYEPYTGEIASPNPDYPQDIKVVTGENTITISNEDNTENQTFNIDLGDLELCKTEEYQDYIYKNNNKWYKYKTINKDVVNIQSITKAYWLTYSNIDYVCIPKENDFIGKNNYNSYLIYSNKVQGTTMLKGWDNIFYINKITSGPNTTSYWLGIPKNQSLDDTKNALQGIVLYYPLVESVSEEITDTILINQLNTLEKAVSYGNQTNVSQENDNLPFIINATALMKNSD